MVETLFWIGIAALLFITLLVFLSFKVVRPDQRAVIERFGEYHEFCEPGIHFLIPRIDKIYVRNITEQMKNVQPSDMITRENLNANVDLDVYYQVRGNETDVKKSFYNVDDYEKQITRLAQTTARNVIGTKEFEEVNSERQKINKRLHEELEEDTDAWGIDVVRVEMKEITPPNDVQESMNEILKAENRKDAAQDDAKATEIEARGKKKAAIEEAKGQKQAAVLEAEGDAQAIELRAQAEANEIKVVNNALRNHFKGEAQEHKKLETVEQSLRNGSKYIVDSEKDLTTVLSEVGGVTPISDQDFEQPDEEDLDLDISKKMEEAREKMDKASKDFEK